MVVTLAITAPATGAEKLVLGVVLAVVAAPLVAGGAILSDIRRDRMPRESSKTTESLSGYR